MRASRSFAALLGAALPVPGAGIGASARSPAPLDPTDPVIAELIAGTLAEGAINSYGMPDSWTNFGEIFADFTVRYGAPGTPLTHTDTDLSSAEEISKMDAEKNNPVADIGDIGILFGQIAKDTGVAESYQGRGTHRGRDPQRRYHELPLRGPPQHVRCSQERRQAAARVGPLGRGAGPPGQEVRPAHPRRRGAARGHRRGVPAGRGVCRRQAGHRLDRCRGRRPEPRGKLDDPGRPRRPRHRDPHGSRAARTTEPNGTFPGLGGP